MDRQCFYWFIVCYCLSLVASSSVVQAVLSDAQAQQIEVFIEQLRIPETEDGAVGGLVAVGAPAVPALMEMALGGPDPFPISLFSRMPADPKLAPRRAAWKALVHIGKPAVPQLIEALGDKEAFGGNASRVLSEIGEPAKSYLINAMEHKDAEVRRCVISLLAGFGDATLHEVLKARHDPDAEVRSNVIVSFLGYKGESPHLVTDALMEFLDYEDPRFSPEAGFVLFTMRPEERVRLSLFLALSSPKWGVRFGTAITYAHAWHSAYLPTRTYCVGPLPTEVVPNLIEGLNKGIEEEDMMLRETAVRALQMGNRAEHYAKQILTNAQKKKKAIEAFPPPTLLTSSIKDGDKAVDITPLNREGIRFEFSNSIDEAEIRIKKINGEPLNWQLRRNSVPQGRRTNSYWIAIVATPGNELISGSIYRVELDVTDFLDRPFRDQIQFSTKE